MRKVLVVLFFVVVFGLPVVWYLFLQTFGENKYALPKIAQYDSSCVSISGPTLLIDSLQSIAHPNEYNAVFQKINENDLFELKLFSYQDCNTSEMLLIDADGWIRSELMINREEVDRLLAEIDIYTLNAKNESQKN